MNNHPFLLPLLAFFSNLSALSCQKDCCYWWHLSFGMKMTLTGAHTSFSTLQRLATLQRQNSRLTALKQLPLLPLRFDGRGPEKHVNRAA
jgi:hypothetical protein